MKAFVADAGEWAGPSDTTADILVDKLISWEVEVVFGFTTAGVLPLAEAFGRKQDKIRYIEVRDAEAAAFMAGSFSRYTGRLGVFVGSAGIVGGMEGLSVLAIGDAVMAGNVVYGRQISGPLHALTAVDLACRVALTSPGVVTLTLSTDIQRKSISEDKPLRLVPMFPRA